jgi:aspartate/tyrosine/aromatic aminotransferase
VECLLQEYLGITGLADFCRHAQKLAFGDSAAVAEGQIVTAQALSGTGSLRVGAEFLSNFYPNKTIYICKPTWGNHNKIFPNGGMAVKQYRCCAQHSFVALSPVASTCCVLCEVALARFLSPCRCNHFVQLGRTCVF